MTAGRTPWENLIRIGILLICALSLAPQPAEFASPNDNAEESKPFKSGERLVYSIQWDPPWYLFFLPRMEAGEAELQYLEEAEYNGKKAVKILFKTHSSGSLSKLAGLKVEDEFLFLSEPQSFCSLYVSKEVREGKRKRRISIEYLKESGQLHFRELDESLTPPKLQKDEIKNNIPGCVQDPLSAVYYLRSMKLQPGFSYKSFLGYDDKIKEINSLVLRQENISIPSGKLPAWRIETAALMGGLFKDGGQFIIWLSADQWKAPLQFEVKVKLGRVIGKLKQLPQPALQPKQL
jgi:hypothetical protein